MVKITKKIIAGVLIAAAILVLLVLWPSLWWFAAKQFNPALSLAPAGIQDTADWKVYTDVRQGFEFKYPEGYAVVNNNKPPILLGAKEEVAVVKAADAGKSGPLLAIDSFDESLMGLGGIDFSLAFQKGSIGCSYGAQCRIYLENRKEVIIAKPAGNPAQMIDAGASKILATMKFFEPSGWRVE